jgi:hypothetical protein
VAGADGAHSLCFLSWWSGSQGTQRGSVGVRLVVISDQGHRAQPSATPGVWPSAPRIHFLPARCVSVPITVVPRMGDRKVPRLARAPIQSLASETVAPTLSRPLRGRSVSRGTDGEGTDLTVRGPPGHLGHARLPWSPPGRGGRCEDRSGGILPPWTPQVAEPPARRLCVRESRADGPQWASKSHSCVLHRESQAHPTLKHWERKRRPTMLGDSGCHRCPCFTVTPPTLHPRP